MLISLNELNLLIEATMVHLQNDEAQKDNVARLADTRRLLEAAHDAFHLTEFPSEPDSCDELIKREENLLSDYDIDGLRHLAEAVRWIVQLCSSIR